MVEQKAEYPDLLSIAKKGERRCKRVGWKDRCITMSQNIIMGWKEMVLVTMR
jgi:hypothetical protein